MSRVPRVGRSRRGLLAAAVVTTLLVLVPAASTVTTARAAMTTGACRPVLSDAPRYHSDALMTPDGKYGVYQTYDETDTGQAFGPNAIVRVDRASGARVFVTPRGTAMANHQTTDPVITPDGRFVAFKSAADNLVPLDTNGAVDVFVRDLQGSTIERISVDSDEREASGASASINDRRDRPAISDDGRFVAFTSTSTVLAPENELGYPHTQLYVRDRVLGTTTRQSVNSGGAPATDGYSHQPAMSADGRFLAFTTSSSLLKGLALGQGTAQEAIVVRDRDAGQLTVATGITDAYESVSPKLSADGATLAFIGTDHRDHSQPAVFDVFRGDWRTRDYALASAASVPASTTDGLAITPDASHVAYIAYLPMSYNLPAGVVYEHLTGERWIATDTSEAKYVRAPLSLHADGTRVAYNDTALTVSKTKMPSITGFAVPFVNGRIRQGASNVAVGLSGFNLEGATLDLGPGITVHSISPTDPLAFNHTAVISVANDAPLGWRYPAISARGCTTSTINNFEVVPGATVTGIAPRYLSLTARAYTLTGDGFTAGGTVAVNGGDVTVTNVSVVSDTKVTFTAVGAAGGAQGARTITWSNPNGTTGTCSACATVDTIAPTVAYVGPSNKSSTIYVALVDNMGVDEAKTGVQVARGGQPVPFDRYVESAGVIRIVLTNPTDGSYTVKVLPRDKAGNVGALVTAPVQRGEIITTLNAYGNFQGGAETAAGDVDGDGVDEIITAAGPGGGPHVRVFKVNARNGTTTELASFFAYPSTFTGGVRVAAADIDGDGTDEIVTGPGRGGAPTVRVFHVNGNGSVTRKASFLAYGSGVKAGISVAGGDVDGDGVDEVVTAPGAGVGPHVRAFRVSAGAASELIGFMAYDPAFTGGVRASTADLNGDGVDEVITGAGAGGGPHVQAFDVSTGAATAVVSFMAYDPAFRGGVIATGGDVDGDGWDELVVSAGGGGGPHVRVLLFADNAIYEYAGFMAYDPSFSGGVSAAAGDFDGDLDDDVITTPGPGMPVQIVARRVL